MGWFTSKNVCAIRFEDIIGEKGGGNNTKQQKVVERVINYLDLNNSKINIDEICECIYFKGSRTFNKGRIHRWKELMSPEIKKIFKEQLGHLLIELDYEKNYEW